MSNAPQPKTRRLTARLIRALEILLKYSQIERYALDVQLGATNSPDTVQKLREILGYECLITKRHSVINRFGETAKVGSYSLTEEGRKKAKQILGGLA